MGLVDIHLYLTLHYPKIPRLIRALGAKMFDAYLVDLLALKEVETDRQTD